MKPKSTFITNSRRKTFVTPPAENTEKILEEEEGLSLSIVENTLTCEILKYVGEGLT